MSESKRKASEFRVCMCATVLITMWSRAYSIAPYARIISASNGP